MLINFNFIDTEKFQLIKALYFNLVNIPVSPAASIIFSSFSLKVTAMESHSMENYCYGSNYYTITHILILPVILKLYLLSIFQDFYNEINIETHKIYFVLHVITIYEGMLPRKSFFNNDLFFHSMYFIKKFSYMNLQYSKGTNNTLLMINININI